MYFLNTIHKLLFHVYFSLISSIPYTQFFMFFLFSFQPLCYSSISESNDTGTLTDTLTCLIFICCVVVHLHRHRCATFLRPA